VIYATEQINAVNASRGWNKILKNGGGGKNSRAPPLIQFAAHLLGHITFLPLPQLRPSNKICWWTEWAFKCVH